MKDVRVALAQIAIEPLDPRRTLTACCACALLKEFRIGATRRAALDESKPYLEPKYRAYADWGLDKPMPKEESLSVPFDDLARDRFIVGTAEECRIDIDRHARLLGVNHFIFRVQWPGMAQEDALAQIARLGREVISRPGPPPR